MSDDLTRLNTPFSKILEELDVLYGELKRAYRIGDANPESNADALLQLMKLFGRALGEMLECPRTDLPTVARG